MGSCHSSSTKSMCASWHGFILDRIGKTGLLNYNNVFNRGINIIIEGGANWKDNTRMKLSQPARYMTNRMPSFG